jgi:hypothetical protein
VVASGFDAVRSNRKPMTLTGNDASEFVDKLFAQHDEEKRRSLAEAKAEAQSRGKEPFDLDKLEQLCDTSSEGRVDPVDQRRERFERMYYVENPSFMTLQELADLITRLSQWA